MNGFKIQQTRGNRQMAGINLCSFMNQVSQSATVNGHPCLRLTHMCTMLPTYGLQDLRELLGMF